MAPLFDLISQLDTIPHAAISSALFRPVFRPLTACRTPGGVIVRKSQIFGYLLVVCLLATTFTSPFRFAA
jgi:hypothetical protein